MVIDSKGPNHKEATLGNANPVTRRNLCPKVLPQLFDGNDPIEDLRLSASVGVVGREATSEDDAPLPVAQLFPLRNLCGVTPTQRMVAWTILEDHDVFTPLDVPSPKCHHLLRPMDQLQIITSLIDGNATQCQPNRN